MDTNKREYRIGEGFCSENPSSADAWTGRWRIGVFLPVSLRPFAVAADFPASDQSPDFTGRWYQLWFLVVFSGWHLAGRQAGGMKPEHLFRELPGWGRHRRVKRCEQVPNDGTARGDPDGEFGFGSRRCPSCEARRAWRPARR